MSSVSQSLFAHVGLCRQTRRYTVLAKIFQAHASFTKLEFQAYTYVHILSYYKILIPHLRLKELPRLQSVARLPGLHIDLDVKIDCVDQSILT